MLLSVYIVSASTSYSDCSIYGNCQPIGTITSPTNYSLVNVNNSLYWQGHTGTDGSWLTGLNYVPYTGANQNVNLGNNNLTATTVSVPQQSGLIEVGNYGTISETSGGWSYITGNNIKASLTTNNQVQKVSSGDIAQFIRMRYDQGISLHTGIGAGDVAGTLYADNVNERLRININGDLMVDSNTLFVNATTNLVGIGTTNPFTALHVNGNILANGTINATMGYGVNGKSGITGNYSMLNSTSLQCWMNFTGGILWGSNC